MPQTPIQVNAPALRAAREAAGLGVAEAASAAGVHRSTLMGWERGKTAPILSTLHTLARVYGTSPQNLILAQAADLRPLHHLRVTAGLLQRDVAAALGVSVSHYGMVEIGRRRVPAHWVSPLSSLYSVSVGQLSTLLGDSLR